MDFVAELALAFLASILGLVIGLSRVSRIVLVPRSRRPWIVGNGLVVGVVMPFLTLAIGRNIAHDLFVLSDRGGDIIYSIWGYGIAYFVGFIVSLVVAAMCGYAAFDRQSDAGPKWPFQEL